MEAGWSRMNDLIVIQASQAGQSVQIQMLWFNPSIKQGLCAYILKHVENAEMRGVVIGHDHRYNSEKWAQLTAAVFITNNVKVYLHRGLVHTPLYVSDHSVAPSVDKVCSKGSIFCKSA